MVDKRVGLSDGSLEILESIFKVLVLRAWVGGWIIGYTLCVIYGFYPMYFSLLIKNSPDQE